MNFMSINLRGVRDQRKVDWVRGLKTSHGIHFLAIQETKVGGLENFMISRFWGRSTFQAEVVDAVGNSGGLLCIWNPVVLKCTSVVKRQRFMVVSGELRNRGVDINVVNVYAFNDPLDRRLLWRDLLDVKSSRSGLWVFVGDFNDVRHPAERLNSEFVALNATYFNQFIHLAGLLEYQMGGKKFTFHSDNGLHKSKLDRYLVCHNFMNEWPEASVVALSNVVSDHCPILLSVVSTDFGPVPCRLFNSWLEVPGVMDLVENLCTEFRFNGPADLGLATKLKWVKFKIKRWVEQCNALLICTFHL
ncbi:uncharacterized protein LOC110917248 [Helianthus annuus]|uniref:uncharacterized protein LOC110917248 n=1 Tax=Helianthus annuus TaxID=4232 RepID=UPI000B8F2B6C|nr:uncharacterized protein LOC110917248 [Helianthus annuus]